MKKEIYKKISIISFCIVGILILNMIVPMFSIATSENGFNMNEIVYDADKKTLTETGTAPEGFKSYKIYWAKGELNIAKLEDGATNEQKIKYIEDIIQWFMNNSIKDVLELSTNVINSSIDIEGNGSYYVLCIADNSNTRAICYRQIVINEVETKPEEKVENVECDNVELLLEKNKEESTIYVSAIAEKGNIVEMKYNITETVLELNSVDNEEVANQNKNFLEKEGKNISVSGNTKNIIANIDDSVVSSEKYINLYIKTDYNNSKLYWSMPVKSIEKENSDENGEVKPEEPKKKEVKEEVKPEEPKKEEVKEEVKPEEPKKEEVKEEVKPEESKKEEVKEEIKEVVKLEESKGETAGEFIEIGNNKDLTQSVEVLPQTGSDNSFILFCTVIFLIIGVCSLKKYKTL